MPPLEIVPALVLGGAALLTVVAGYALRSLARATSSLRAAQAAHAARSSEIATLHALGPELLATRDPERIFAIVDRECRKVLPVEFVALARIDEGASELRVIERGADASPARVTTRALAAGLEADVLRSRRALTGAAEDGSTAVAPLLVADRVPGLLTVRSRGPGGFQAHQVALLTAIAQQAAAALELAGRDDRASVDALTGLARRDPFLRRLEEEHARALRYRGRFVVLMIDLDGFREVDIRHGHPTGDRLLRAVGAAIRGQLRRTDLGARFGGDAFCALLPETDLAGGRVIAERIRAAIAQLVVTVDGVAIRCTASIGLAAHPDHDRGEPRALLLRADQALYQAKGSGKNRVIAYAPRTA